MKAPLFLLKKVYIMDNQALALLVAVALFGALAIGIISRTETSQQQEFSGGRYTAAGTDNTSRN